MVIEKSEFVDKRKQRSITTKFQVIINTQKMAYFPKINGKHNLFKLQSNSG